MINTGFTSFIITLFPVMIIFAQFSCKLNYEGGYFRNSGSTYINQNDFQTSLDGMLKYEDYQDDRNISGEIRIRPELYGIKNELKILKLRAKGTFYKFEENYTWGLNISVQKYYYKNSIIDINYDNLILSSDLRFDLSDKFNFSVSPGLAYQRINSDGFRDLDLMFLEAKLGNSFSQYFNVSYGLYIEKYFIDNKPLSLNLKSKNDGWRMGPLVNLTYNHDIIFNAGYQFLFNFSDVTYNSSYEQSVRLILGKILLPDWSAFILVDLYFRHFLLKESIDIINGILYSQMDSENRFYFKTAYELWDDFELYSKFGYTRENLDYIKYKIAGWNLALGIEFNF
jgi:hypothetical protein